MSELTFSQPERRPFAVPVLAALALLAAVLWGVHAYLLPPGRIALESVQTAILPATTVYKTDSIVVGANEVDHTLFVACTVRLENGLRFPITIDDISLTLTDRKGAEMTVKALGRAELANAELSFPKLAGIAGTALERERQIPARQSAMGTAVFSFPLQDSVWNTRDSAVLEVTPYHQSPVRVAIPH